MAHAIQTPFQEITMNIITGINPKLVAEKCKKFNVFHLFKHKYLLVFFCPIWLSLLTELLREEFNSIKNSCRKIIV